MTAIEVSSGTGIALVPRAVSVLAPVFEDDPVIGYMLNGLPRQERLEYLPAYFTALLTAAALNRAIIFETACSQCCCVVMPPGEDVGNPWTMIPAGLLGMLGKLGFSGCKKMIWEYTNLADAAKKREMGKGKYYYVFFIGTAIEGQGQGLASKVIRSVQKLATSRGLPVWLEATTEKSRHVYSNLDFKDVGRFVLGKGKARAIDGEREVGGHGVTLWPMIWRPSRISNGYSLDTVLLQSKT